VVVAAASIDRVAAPAVSGNAVSVPAPISTARNAAQSRHAELFLIAKPAYEAAGNLGGYPSWLAEALGASA
jgi:hypothetical protein